MTTNPQHITLSTEIGESENNLRLDQALAGLFSDYSRGQWQEWIKAGHVLINGEPCTRPRMKVHEGDQINVNAELKAQANWQAQKIPLEVVFEDDAILVINKPAGLVVHPGAGNPDKTLLNALLHHTPELNTLPRAGIIHRLDKDTTGLLVIAKNLKAHHALVKMMQAREISREYEAIVHGVMVAGGSVKAPIGRHPQSRTRMSVVKSGKPAVTHYRVLEKFPHHTHVRVSLETGRTHQIRVHMAHINYAIVGDPVYAKNKLPQKNLAEPLKDALKAMKRQALHAAKLSFTHPETGELLSFEAPLPEDMQNLLKLLRE